MKTIKVTEATHLKIYAYQQHLYAKKGVKPTIDQTIAYLFEELNDLNLLVAIKYDK